MERRNKLLVGLRAGEEKRDGGLRAIWRSIWPERPYFFRDVIFLLLEILSYWTFLLMVAKTGW